MSQGGAGASPRPPAGAAPRGTGIPWSRIGYSALLVASGCAGGLGQDARVSSLVWLALWAPAAGFLAGRRRPGGFLLTPVWWWIVVLGLPALGFEWADRRAAAAAVAVLFYVGHGLGALTARRRTASWGWSGAALLLFLGGALAALPSVGGALARPLPPPLTAQLLDLSPVVWVAESGGLDWMRHPAVYELAGAADIGPDLRVARSSGPGALLACVLLYLACWLLGRYLRVRE